MGSDILGIKVYAFGWEGVPRFWVYAGAGVVAVMIAAMVFHRGRERKSLKLVIDRSPAAGQAGGLGSSTGLIENTTSIDSHHAGRLLRLMWTI